MEPKRITDDDLKLLFAGETVWLGKTEIEIQPLSLEDVAWVARKLTRIRAVFDKAGIHAGNYDEKLDDLVHLLLEHAPEVLERASGIHREDLVRLPFGKACEILKIVTDVNIESQAGLEKNLPVAVIQAVRLINWAMGMSSSTSSDTATDGQTSESTAPVRSASSSEPPSVPTRYAKKSP